MFDPGRVWLSNVACTASPEDISDCVSDDWGSTNCSHADDVYINCTGINPSTQGHVLGIKRGGGWLCYHRKKLGTVPRVRQHRIKQGSGKNV